MADKNQKIISNFKFQISNISKITNKFSYYLRIWLMMGKNSFMIILNQKKLFALFLTGKFLRFIFFISFLYFLVIGSNNLAGYNVNQTIFFFLTFNLVDVTAQFLFREVYNFRNLVVSGDLDLILVKPISPLFRVLLGAPDAIDFVTLPPLIFVVGFMGSRLNPTTSQIFFYILLIINGLLISTAFHIAVLALGIITFEIDHTIMIYRDIVNLGKFPVDIYKQPLQGILTYLIPVGIMITLPAKALMGLASPWGILASFVLGILAILLSLKFWKYSLVKYSSASS
jgi:ABC-2 type transport system permease protein